MDGWGLWYREGGKKRSEAILNGKEGGGGGGESTAEPGGSMASLINQVEVGERREKGFE